MRRGLLDWPEPQPKSVQPLQNESQALSQSQAACEANQHIELPSNLALRTVDITAGEHISVALRSAKAAAVEELPFAERKTTITSGTRRYLSLRELNEQEEKLLSVLQSKPWIADCQPAPPEYVGSDALINYLAAYISGTAIHDRRLLCIDDDHVEFSIKDCRNKCRSTEKVNGTEFVKRFALHVLPSRLQRVRYAGLFQAEGLTSRLKVCRAALDEYQQNKSDACQTNEKKRVNGSPQSPNPWRENEEGPADDEFTGLKCDCGQMMELSKRIEPAQTMRINSCSRVMCSRLKGEVRSVGERLV